MFKWENKLISNIFEPKKSLIWSIMQLFAVEKTFAKKYS